MIAAVFDLDRTLLPGTTAERIFLRYLVRKRMLGPAALFRTAMFAFRAGLRDAVDRIRADRPYLSGLHDATLRLHGRRCATDQIRPMLSEQGIDRLRQHQERGDRTVLLSGSLPYVVEPLADALQFDEVICSRLVVHEQRLAGQLSGLHPYGDAKAILMRESAEANGVDLAASWCYADHHTDEPLLQLFGNPVCVNPSTRLRQIAVNNSWSIEGFG